MDHLCYLCLFLLCFRACLFIAAFWSPAGKGLTSWLSFVMSNWLCFFRTKMAYAAASPAPPAYRDHMTGDG